MVSPSLARANHFSPGFCSFLSRAFGVAILVSIAFSFLLSRRAALAEDKKPEKKEPPRITGISPFVLVRGTINKVRLRGFTLADATAVRLAGVSATIKSKGKADPPKPFEAAKVGDSQIELEINVPADLPATASAGTDRLNDSASLVVTTPTGDTPPQAVILLNAASVVDEKEPNGGFASAQEIELGKPIRGAIQESADVDVFKFHGQAKQTIVAEVNAARHGSLLDSLLTLYNDRSQILAVNDDGDTGPGGHAGSDSLLRFTLPSDGVYYLALTDANDIGSPGHAYLLSISTALPSTRPTVPPAAK